MGSEGPCGELPSKEGLSCPGTGVSSTGSSLPVWFSGDTAAHAGFAVFLFSNPLLLCLSLLLPSFRVLGILYCYFPNLFELKLFNTFILFLLSLWIQSLQGYAFPLITALCFGASDV